MKFADIEKFTGYGNYRVDVEWDYVEETAVRYCGYGLDLNPDFQRGHVWTDEQRIAFVEYGLCGGRSGMDIYFNCRGWMDDYRGPFVIVDGLQRLTAVRLFLDDKLAVFGGHFFSDFEDRMRTCQVFFHININNLNSRIEVLRWYLEMNTGGVVHTDEEIERVRGLLDNEMGKDND